MCILNCKYHYYPIFFGSYYVFSKIRNHILVTLPTPPFNNLPPYILTNTYDDYLNIM